VTQGGAPILGAQVIATIERPDKTRVQLDLYDAGASK